MYKKVYIELGDRINYKISSDISVQETQEYIKWYYNSDTYNSDKSDYFVIYFDKIKKEVFVYNDKIGSNEIFVYLQNKKIIITTELKKFEKIDVNSVYDFLMFSYISPPYTIYENVYSVPLSSYIYSDFNTIKIKQYNSFNVLPKLKYNEELQLIDELLYKEFLSLKNKRFSVSLSGGMDSGGLLGYIYNKLKKPVNSYSFATWGEESFDMISAKKSAKFVNSPHTILYPNNYDLLSIYDENINNFSQPMDFFNFVPNFLLFSNAKENSDIIVSGSGSEAVLGCLKHNQFVYKMRYLDYLPKKLLFYPLYKLGKLSKNQYEIITENSQVKRTIKMLAPFRDVLDYRLLDYSFKRDETILEEVYDVNKNILDNVVLMRLRFIHSQTHYTFFKTIARKVGIEYFAPFYTNKIVELLLHTSNETRKAGNWDKKLIRDLFKPYASPHLQTNKPKGFVIPYLKYIDINYLLKELKDSEFLNNYIDIQRYLSDIKIDNYGVMLLRLYSLHKWANQ